MMLVNLVYEYHALTRKCFFPKFNQLSLNVTKACSRWIRPLDTFFFTFQAGEGGEADYAPSKQNPVISLRLVYSSNIQ